LLQIIIKEGDGKKHGEIIKIYIIILVFFTAEFARRSDGELCHLYRVDLVLKFLDKVLVKALQGVVDLWEAGGLGETKIPGGHLKGGFSVL